MVSFFTRQRWQARSVHRTCAHTACRWLLAGLFTLAGFSVATSADGSSDAPRVPSAGAPRYVGSMTCSATACHGAAAVPNVDRQSRSELIFWLEHDPHARAARSLTSPLGLRMMEQLGIVHDGQVLDPVGLRNCQACHNPLPDPHERAETFPQTGEGIGCETCHGPAEHWRTEHYRSEKSLSRLAELGMVQTKDLATRTQLCVGCHVGGRGDVNHDLIAAGHPVLKFEMAAYHDLYPKHWRAERERQLQPDLPWHLWFYGQRYGAIAAVKQLKARAEDPARPWPELSEWSCYGCHHDLVYPSWRAARGFDRRRPGALPTSRWYLRWLDKLTPNDTTLQSQLDQTLEELRGVLESQPVPDRQQVAERAAKLQSILESLPGAAPGDGREAIAQLVHQLSAASATPSWFSEPVGHDWDSAAQAYLMLRAAGESCLVNSPERGRLPSELAAVRNALAFPAGWNSPRELDWVPPDGIASPAAVTDQLRAVAEAVLAAGGSN